MPPPSARHVIVSDVANRDSSPQPRPPTRDVTGVDCTVIYLQRPLIPIVDRARQLQTAYYYTGSRQSADSVCVCCNAGYASRSAIPLLPFIRTVVRTSLSRRAANEPHSYTFLNVTIITYITVSRRHAILYNISSFAR